MPSKSPKVGYIVKRYPKYSETFIVREILAQEAAGLDIEIFSLRPPNDSHFQEAIARVRGPVNYLHVPLLEQQVANLLAPRTDDEPRPVGALTVGGFWSALKGAGEKLPGIWSSLEMARDERDARNVYQAISIARQVKEKGICHLHASFSNTPATVARMAAYFSGITYSFTARAKDIFHESIRHEHLKQKLDDASAVVTITDYNLKYLRETYGESADKVQKIYNGLDFELFPYQSPHNRPPMIVSVGRLVAKKGFSDLIEACAILAGRQVEFKCQIVGSGPLKEELRKQIEEMGLNGKVELTGPRPQSEVKGYMQNASVFTLPCIVDSEGDRDGLPNVLFESMALGTPCVSTDVTGIPEILHDNQTGLMVPQHSPSKLAEALEKLLKDSELRVRLAAEARQLIEREFNADRNAARRRSLFGVVAPADLAFSKESKK